jgi:UDP-N-acetylmuramoyl-L-alanyl-D-glutamate--2,6-diaminopimelate ligase
MMEKRLSDLVQRDVSHLGLGNPLITGVTSDSRRVRPGYLFTAMPGSRVDGRSFIRAAVKAGAAAILAPDDVKNLEIPVVHALDPRRAYALAASHFHGRRQPATVVAVTGTNGKTSVANFAMQIFATLGHKAASIGTLGVKIGDESITPAGMTTPDAGEVARLLADLADRGVTHLALEASSHGIDQRRLDGVRIAAAGFTNLTQDHLDYHGTMGVYRAAKLRLFDSLLPRNGTAVLNADSDAFSAFAATARLSGQTLYSVGASGQGLSLVSRTPTAAGQTLAITAGGETFTVNLPLAGDFQASNALVAAGLVIAIGEPVDKVLAALEHLTGVAGRLQRVASRGGAEAYVDYAHTPDGLETVLSALRPHTRGRLIVVFGAGGDRDRTKRPIMGEIAARLADIAIVTDDNPRSEDPAAIRAAVLDGAKGASEIGDRREAIVHAASLLRDGDILVVAGKGHEQGQTVGDVVHPFDDVAVTREALGG